MQPNRRWFPRFSVREEVSVSFSDAPSMRGLLIDISRTGAYIADVPIPSDKYAKIKFEISNVPPNTESMERACSVLPGRSGKSGGCALQFHTPLTGGQLALLVKALQVSDSIELAREDYRIVNNEISEILLCRSHLFVGTMAAICAWVIAAVGIGITNNLDSPKWIAIGVSLPWGLLTIAILSMLQKANSVNLRRGFLAALSDFLKRNAVPPNYLGWAHLIINRAECRSRFENNLCPTKNKACWERERDQGLELTKEHHLFSNIWDSFTALSSFIYGILYCFSIALISYVGYWYWMQLIKEWPFPTLLMTAIIGASIPIVGYFFYSQLKNLRKGKNSPESYYFQWRAIFRCCRSIANAEELSVQKNGKVPQAA